MGKNIVPQMKQIGTRWIFVLPILWSFFEDRIKGKVFEKIAEIEDS